jgi:hypothetical protein
MKNHVTEILNRHTDALLAGDGEAATHLETAHPEGTSLFKTAERLKSALTPIKSIAPRAEFVSKIKRQLVHEANILQTEEAARKESWLWLAVGLGGLAYAAGVMAMSLKSALWVLGLVALATGWRKRAKLAHAKETVRP